MAQITFVRHGQTEWNRIERVQGKTDNPLNNNGKDQATKAAPKLKDTQWDVIYSSPLIRALQTAQIICDELDIEERIHLEDGFAERNFGPLEGGNYDAFREAMDNKLELDGLETETEIMTRVRTAADKAIEWYPGKNILVFCHSHVIKAMLTSVDPEHYNFRSPLANLAIVTFEYDGNGNYQLLSIE
ncbi:histidine phosphatase family protein [Culicoidibacter larvae]|uniref:Histidine phosphatase family protein n=1 Tax=Culicoidibacter larvae TaxID=2579976 RepID=A0A5R8Q852_9FIRM|nr:histidine phosphatase family protein [Culicoidibacter larvae]TLG71757.1 histidine phosphatase family protein [Culicoidibacter larvae]